MKKHLTRIGGRRPGRVLLWLLLSLFAAGVGLLGYRYWDARCEFQDSERIRKIQDAELPPAGKADVRGDWPQWRGPARDGVSRESGLLKQWPAKGPKVLWEAPAGPGYSSFAIHDGMVYTMFVRDGEETVVCLDADNGKELWHFGYSTKMNFKSGQGNGPRSTPTIADGKAYTVGATGIFHCLDAKTGKKLWRHNLLDELNARSAEWGTAFSVLVHGNLAYTSPGGRGGNSLAAFDKETGKLVWKALDDRPGYSSPIFCRAAGVDQVVFFTGEALVGVVPDSGTLLWRFPWPTEYDCNIATPIAVGDYLFISSNYGHGCALLEISKAADGTLQANRVYENRKMRNHFASCVRLGDYLYGFDSAGSGSVALLTCMELRTGEVRWRERSIGKGSLIAADGVLIILSERGKLALVEANPESYRELASWQAFRNKCWTPPALAHGRLFIRDEEKVLCLELAPQREAGK